MLRRIGFRVAKEVETRLVEVELRHTPFFRIPSSSSKKTLLSFRLLPLEERDTLNFHTAMLLRAAPPATSPSSLAGRRQRTKAAAAAASAGAPPSSRQMPVAAAGARRMLSVATSALAEAPPRTPVAAGSSVTAPSPSAGGHAALLHGLGAVGDVPPKLMPFLLRLAHVK